MSDLLMREQALLNEEEWARIDETIVSVARQILISRRFIHLFGPLGPGVQSILVSGYAGTDAAVVDLTGEADVTPVRPEGRTPKFIPTIYKDFILSWRDIEASRASGTPLDVAAAAAAANFAAFAEDELILHGNADLGLEGLLNAGGKGSIAKGDWGKAGNGLGSIVGAIEKLTEAGQFGPYAVVLSPSLFAALHRVVPNTGVLEVDQVRALATAGVFQTPVLANGEGVVVASGPQNMDLVISQDLTAAYLGPDKMDHLFRVLESLVLRIKRANAIVTLD